MRTCHLCCCEIFSLSTSHVCSLKVNFEVTFLQRFICHIIVRGFWFFSFSAECHISTLNIMHMHIWWNSVSLYLNFKFLVCLVYTDHVYPKTELLLYSDINVLSFVDIQLQWKGLEMSYLYCSPLPQTLCAACGEQCDRLSLTQLLPWAKSVNGRGSEVDVSLCLMVHPPSLRLRSLLSSNFQGQGTDVEAEEEAQLCSTLHLHYTPASNNKWALIKFFCVLFFYTKLFCEGERGHGVDLYHSSENFIFLSYFLSPWFAKGSKEEPPLHHPSHSDWQANVL